MDFKKLLEQYLPKLIEFIVNFLTGKDQKAIVAVAAETQAVKEAIQAKVKVLILKRLEYREDGIFSEVSCDGKRLFYTLEHSYSNKPKLFNGTFKCVLGPHRLHGMTEDFQTYEVMGVTGHSGILFHWGNYNKDSEGCLLVGEKIVDSNGAKMVTNSRATFAKFIQDMSGITEFNLVVS